MVVANIDSSFCSVRCVFSVNGRFMALMANGALLWLGGATINARFSTMLLVLNTTHPAVIPPTAPAGNGMFAKA